MTGKKSFFFFNKVSTKENKRRAKSKGGWGIQKMTKKEKNAYHHQMVSKLPLTEDKKMYHHKK